MMITTLIPLFQKVNIEEKMQNAPNSQYEIGVVIGTYLPMLVLAIIAYATYFYFKKKAKQKPE